MFIQGMQLLLSERKALAENASLIAVQVLKK
jgi:hypothetical protein